MEVFQVLLAPIVRWQVGKHCILVHRPVLLLKYWCSTTFVVMLFLERHHNIPPDGCLFHQEVEEPVLEIPTTILDIPQSKRRIIQTTHNNMIWKNNLVLHEHPTETWFMVMMLSSIIMISSLVIVACGTVKVIGRCWMDNGRTFVFRLFKLKTRMCVLFTSGGRQKGG